MKKFVSVRELIEYCEYNKPQCIQFYTENQKWYKASDPCKIKMTFPTMLICENPNLICLKAEANILSFDRVKFIEIDTESTVLGTLITVFCGKFDKPGYDITYKLIAT